MVVFLLSLTGIPPLFGFLGKFYLFAAAMDAGYLWLAVIGILNSVLGLGVYLRLIVPMYATSESAGTARVPLPLSAALVLAVTATLGFGIAAGVLLR